MTASQEGIDDSQFASSELLQVWCDRLGELGYRGTGSAAHERAIELVMEELQVLPGVTIRSEPLEILRWLPTDGSLEQAGALRVGGDEVPVAGAVPYSSPGTRIGDLTYLPPGTRMSADNAAGKVILRDFPQIPLPYDAVLGLGLHLTQDCESLRGEIWDRPGLADGILHDDLLSAGAAGAAGVIFGFDLPREQIAGYCEPHRGTHYRVPAVFVGVDEALTLRRLAESRVAAEITIRAEAGRAVTRNVHAVLPGQTGERIILVTHTDGATWVQENGIAALLALARYFCALPIERRHRTIEFAFTTAHLHISREGAAHYAAELDAQYEAGEVAFVFALEHLGARELVPVNPNAGPGRRLEFTTGAEAVLWAVGPSETLQRAVVEATDRRHLERVVVVPGLGAAVDGQVPRIVSFGGLGTYFHMHLVPTTSIITGPWSLWAPAFGAQAVDINRLRQQAIAAGDVVAALDRVPLELIAGDYLADRQSRAHGAPVGTEIEPPEVAPE